MAININGIAHIQLTVSKRSSLFFWRRLCEFLSMSPLVDGDDVHYSIGGRTGVLVRFCLLYTSPSPRDRTRSRMPSSA